MISNLLVVIVICRHVGDLGALRRKFCCADASIVTRRSVLSQREATKLDMQRVFSKEGDVGSYSYAGRPNASLRVTHESISLKLRPTEPLQSSFRAVFYPSSRPV